jgi:hypothetical protein
MLRTVITTGAIALVILAVFLGIGVFVRSTLSTEYLEFGLALLLFLVIIVGSYWFVVRGTRRQE